ncbi:MAG: aldehyde dehydrogenase family protein [Pseudanabaenaceae cyanobacterium bins.68]|nr:aldehyde dehydrogenase family protein [Pseudanabaenaceae cyanobacterium bins.68]
MTSTAEAMATVVHQAHIASFQLAKTEVKVRDRLIKYLISSLTQHKSQILEANTLDLEASRLLELPEVVIEWLRLTPERLQGAIACLEQLALLSDPLANPHTYDGVKRIPIGTIAFVHEAFPLVAMVAAGMCIKAGNSIILRGGNECQHTQGAIAQIIEAALDQENMPPSSVCLAPEGSSIKELVTQEKYLRLVIPYGRPSFVQQVSKQTTVSALPTAMGNCHIYISASASLEEANRLIGDSRSSEPDPVNAIEKVLIHRHWLQPSLGELIKSWQKKGWRVLSCAMIQEYAQQSGLELSLENHWNQVYLDERIAIKVVENLPEAITWINVNGSGHADCILTDSLKESNQFAAQVRSSMIFINASNRFVRHSMLGANGNRTVALGMTSLKNRGASRNPGMIDLNALTTTKRVVVG